MGSQRSLPPNGESLTLGLYSVSISAMYLGPRPLRDLKTSKSTLKSILHVTGSQCKDLRTGMICSDFLVLMAGQSVGRNYLVVNFLRGAR